jgi:hypothetical protein
MKCDVRPDRSRQQSPTSPGGFSLPWRPATLA